VTADEQHLGCQVLGKQSQGRRRRDGLLPWPALEFCWVGIGVLLLFRAGGQRPVICCVEWR
jgi:hypothetical protein